MKLSLQNFLRINKYLLGTFCENLSNYLYCIKNYAQLFNSRCTFSVKLLKMEMLITLIA